jgi:hypothetical protein
VEAHYYDWDVPAMPVTQNLQVNGNAGLRLSINFPFLSPFVIGKVAGEGTRCLAQLEKLGNKGRKLADAKESSTPKWAPGSKARSSSDQF